MNFELILSVSIVKSNAHKHMGSFTHFLSKRLLVVTTNLLMKGLQGQNMNSANYVTGSA